MTELEKARDAINLCDREMAELFIRRMEAVDKIADYKRAEGLPVLDAAREAEVIRRNCDALGESPYREEYRALLTAMMAISRSYQSRKNGTLYVDLGARGYEVTVESGGLARVGERFDLGRRCLLVTDSGVPAAYTEAVRAACGEPTLVCLPMGEATKNIRSYEKLLRILSERGFTRTDCVVAVGGGVVGDLAGFAAATYLRGIDFYNIPTTLLSEVDSSVGGKTGIDLDGVKNQVGAFHQPRGVLIDPEVLSTLPQRQFACGMAEVIKMAATFDADFFAFCERAHATDAAEIIRRAVAIKRDVVMHDEYEGGLRRVLNFGHTVGHAVETLAGGRLLHGECVAIGMLPMASPEVRPRLRAVLERWGLPTGCPYAPDALLPLLTHDKKMLGNEIAYIYVGSIGSYEIRRATPEALCRRLAWEE